MSRSYLFIFRFYFFVHLFNGLDCGLMQYLFDTIAFSKGNSGCVRDREVEMVMSLMTLLAGSPDGDLITSLF